jgi:hypothetical protein
MLVDPVGLEGLAGDRDPWLAAYAMNEHKSVLDNSCFGVPYGYPMLDDVFTAAQKNLARGVTHTHFVSGPRAFRRAWQATSPRPAVFWVGPDDNDRVVSRDFYASQDPPLDRVATLSRGFPIVHISPLTPEERGYSALRGGQQPL